MKTTSMRIAAVVVLVGASCLPGLCPGGWKSLARPPAATNVGRALLPVGAGAVTGKCVTGIQVSSEIRQESFV